MTAKALKRGDIICIHRSMYTYVPFIILFSYRYRSLLIDLGGPQVRKRRGLMAAEALRKGDVIVSVPQSLLFSPQTANRTGSKRETDRETDRQTASQTDRQRDRQTDRE